MIETLLGGLLGGAFRLAPEILKWFDRQGERSHELAMQDKALEFEKLRGAQRMAEIGASADAAWNSGAIEALKAAVASQGQPSGIKWVDAWNGSIRPSYATVALVLWLVKVAAQGFKMDAFDAELLAVISGFYFADRSLGKRGK